MASLWMKGLYLVGFALGAVCLACLMAASIRRPFSRAIKH